MAETTQTDTTGLPLGNQQPVTVMTSRFGEIEVMADKIITATNPFPGFPESKRFVLRPHGSDSPLMWLQSLDNEKLAFVVISPALIIKDYYPPINKALLAELEATASDEIELLLILTIPTGKPRELTANLLGPIMINATKRLARQIVLDPAHYNPCHPVFGDRNG